MSKPAKTWININSSPRTAKAKAAPKSEEVEKITPVRKEPISLSPSIKNKIDKPMLKTPTTIKYGKTESGTRSQRPRTPDTSNSELPPSRHFADVTSNKSSLKHSSLLRLLSIPQKRQAPTIITFPTNASVSVRLPNCAFVVKKTAPAIRRTIPNQSFLCAFSLRKKIAIRAVEEIPH